MANGQSYAVSIEHILCNVFGCERFGFGGVVNSDFIRKQPFTAILSGLSFIYATAGREKQLEIEAFIEEFSFYSEMSIDGLLSFDTPTKMIEGVTIEINYNNGEKAIEDMIEKFRKICR
jgi:hypothetical protein